MKKRFLSILLSLCMVLALMPATAFAEDNEEPTETPVCTCEAVCTEETRNTDCPICGVEGATIENCGKYEAPVEETESEQTAVTRVQAMLDALPTVEELENADEATVNAAYEAAQDAYDALEALSPDDVKQITGMGKLAALMDWFNGQASTLADPTNETALKEALAAAAALTEGGTVTLGSNITITSTLEINGTVTLDLNGYTLTYESESDGSVIRVNSGADLTLEDNSEDKTGTITGGHAGDGENGGGVLGTDADFTMKGGTISSCTADKGGGVFIGDHGKFTMVDGTISSCTADEGGGVFIDGISLFTMEGGTITDCTATQNGGGVYCNRDSVFTMEGGTITDCTTTRNGGGVFITSSSRFNMEDGTITDCTAINGGGVFNSGSFTMKGGTITDCTATNGGGVYNHPFSELINTSTTGATICYGTLYNDNGTIDGNLVEFKIDDGIYAWELVPTNGKAVEPTAPTKTGFIILEGWYEKDDAGAFKANAFDFDTTITAGTTLYAKWECAHIDETPKDHKCDICGKTISTCSGGTATCKDNAVCDYCGKPYGELDGSNHVGTLGEWQKDGNGHWKTYSCCPIVKGAESAHNFGADGKCECGAVQYTVTFDANGGTVDPTSATTDTDGKLTLTELPTPTRSGSYRFDGWFTEKNGGTAVTVDTVYEAHTTVYAHWTYTGSTTPDYCVIKAAAGEGGSITPSGRAAVLYGASKTFTITPNDGYAIADVKVDGKSVGAVKTYTFERVRGDHTIEAVFMKATGNPQTGVDVPFTDVSENDWFYEDVAYVYANDLMKGTSETTFSPAVTTTRGMIVTILYRLEGEPTVSDNCPFEDVKSGSYYEKAITWAAANEIVGGYGNGKFGPDDPITREQMAVILYRYTQYKGMDVSVGEDTNILSYNDAQEISEYAFSAMQWACGESILNGSDGNLMPQGNATRAQVAAILHRFCENILK